MTQHFLGCRECCEKKAQSSFAREHWERSCRRPFWYWPRWVQLLWNSLCRYFQTVGIQSQCVIFEHSAQMSPWFCSLSPAQRRRDWRCIGMHAERSQGGLSHVGRCRSISRVQGDALMTPDSTTIQVHCSG